MRTTFIICLCAGLLFGAGACYSSEVTLKLSDPAGSSVAANPVSTPNLQQPAKPAPAKQQPVSVGRIAVARVALATIYRRRAAAGRPYIKVRKGTALAIVASKGGWYGVLMANGKLGWIVPTAIEFTQYVLVARDTASARSMFTSRGGRVSSDALGTEVIRTAASYAGTRYVYGGNSAQRGMDCSAFVRTVFSEQGVPLPRTSRQQARVGDTVPLNQLKPGDRLYFACSGPNIDHTGIYAGNGLFVHCSSRRAGVGVDSLSSDFFWNSLVVAKRAK